MAYLPCARIPMHFLAVATASHAWSTLYWYLFGLKQRPLENPSVYFGSMLKGHSKKTRTRLIGFS